MADSAALAFGCCNSVALVGSCLVALVVALVAALELAVLVAYRQAFA